MCIIRLLLLLSVVLNSPSFASGLVASDSIGMEAKNGLFYILHRVEGGETIVAIGRKYGVSIETIKAINRLSSDVLKVNQVLRVPFRPQALHTSPKTKTTYTVASGDNLFRIAQKFGMTLYRIRQINHLSSDVVSLGQVLIVETVPSSQTSSSTKEQWVPNRNVPDNQADKFSLRAGALTLDTTEVEVESTEWAQKITKSNLPQPIYHTVMRSETLYSIGQLYGVEEDSLFEWNELRSSTISMGQELIIGFAEPKEDVVKTTVREKPVFTSVEDSIMYELAQIPSKYYKKGSGEMISNRVGDNSPNKLALFRGVPVGTLIRVVETGAHRRSVLVRVIGTIPEHEENQDVLIKLSKSACNALGVLNKRFPVEVIYDGMNPKKK